MDRDRFCPANAQSHALNLIFRETREASRVSMTAG